MISVLIWADGHREYRDVKDDARFYILKERVDEGQTMFMEKGKLKVSEQKYREVTFRRETLSYQEDFIGPLESPEWYGVVMGWPQRKFRCMNRWIEMKEVTGGR